MGTTVMIKVTGSQIMQNGEDRRVEMYTTGTLTREGEAYRLEYEESELSGMAGTVTKIAIEDEMVLLERVGEYPSQMVFAEGKKYINFFSTPYGEIEMGIYPMQIDTHFMEKHGQLNLKYLMEIEGQVQSTNRLMVTYKKQLKREDLNLDN